MLFCVLQKKSSAFYLSSYDVRVMYWLILFVAILFLGVLQSFCYAAR